MSRWASRSDSATNAIWRLLLRLALIAALVYGCYRLRGVITTVFIAAVIAYVLDPMVVWLCHRPGFVNFHFHLASAMARCQAGLRSLVTRRPPEMPYVRLRRHSVRAYATLYVFVLSVIVLWQGAKLIVTPFVAEFKSATSPEGRRWAMSKKEALLQSYNEQAPDWARAEKLQEQVKTFDLPRHLQTVALDAGQRFLEGLKNVVEIVLLPVLAFYFLIDGRKLKHEFVALLPRGRIPEGLRIVNEFNRIMRAFIAGQFILCLLAGVVVGTGLAALGVKYPFILGVLAGVTRAIPIIGP